MRLISSALICISSLLPSLPLEAAALQLALHPQQLRAQAAVPFPGLDLRDEPPDDAGVRAGFEDDAALRGLRQGLPHVAQLLLGKLLRAGDRGAHPTDLLVHPLAVAAGDARYL